MYSYTKLDLIYIKTLKYGQFKDFTVAIDVVTTQEYVHLLMDHGILVMNYLQNLHFEIMVPYIGALESYKNNLLILVNTLSQ